MNYNRALKISNHFLIIRKSSYSVFHYTDVQKQGQCGGSSGADE